jgi:hypothetical protein
MQRILDEYEYKVGNSIQQNATRPLDGACYTTGLHTSEDHVALRLQRGLRLGPGLYYTESWLGWLSLGLGRLRLGLSALFLLSGIFCLTDRPLDNLDAVALGQERDEWKH